MTISDYVQAQVGAAYVYGATGRPCTPALRRAQMAQYRDFAPSIARHCPVLSGKQGTCAGCKYHGRKAFDCAQLTRRAVEAAGGTLPSGAKSQYYRGDWESGGPIEALPLDQEAILYRRSGDQVPHTGVYTGDGYVVDARGHAQGVVRSLLHSYRWTDYKIPRLRGAAPLPDKKPDSEVVTMPRMLQVEPGVPLMRGQDVLDVQAALVARGYSVGEKGPDGIYGWDTATAVKAWQADQGLQADGRWKYTDQERMDRLLTSPPVIIPVPVDTRAMLDELDGLARRIVVLVKVLREGAG